MNKTPATSQIKPTTATAQKIHSIINGCNVTINFTPKSDCIIPEIKRMMLSGIAKT